MERFEIKGRKNDECLSVFLRNTIPHGKCFVQYLHTCVCVSEISLVRWAHLFDYWYVNSSCINTIHAHFPWSIVYNLIQLYLILYRASDISWKKKAKFRWIFRGKFAEKSADFAGFSRGKSQNLQKNRPISWDFSEKKVKFRRILRGKFLVKLADFTGKFRGNFRQETIRVKNSRFCWIFFCKFC